MARDFDGTNDNLVSADNALAGMNTAAKTVSCWLVRDTNSPSTDDMIAGLQSNGGAAPWRFVTRAPTTAGSRPQWVADWSTDGVWTTTNDVSNNDRHHLAVTYDRGATTNDPVFYVDGVSVAVTELVAPVGTAVTGDDTLKMGESSTGTQDLDGSLQHVAIYTTILSDADINRTMWWGRGQGGVLAYYPFVTTKLADEGSATDTLTATGTTMVPMVTPVVRPGSRGMSMGAGW